MATFSNLPEISCTVVPVGGGSGREFNNYEKKMGRGIMDDTKSFEQAKKELDTEETVSKIYSLQKTVMKTVLEGVPFFGTFISESLEQKFDSYQSKKRQLFVETILANKSIITSDKINESFIINVAKIFELVDRCATDDKIVMYGNLVRNGYFESDEQISNDDFEEYESILKDMSEREIKYLVVFAEHARKSDDRALKGKALGEYCQVMKLDYPNINPIAVLNRLRRTGFVSEKPAWSEFGEAGEDDIVVNGVDSRLIMGNAFELDSGYDDFERIVLEAYDSGKRI